MLSKIVVAVGKMNEQKTDTCEFGRKMAKSVLSVKYLTKNRHFTDAYKPRG